MTRAKFIQTCIVISGVGLFWEKDGIFFYFNGDLISASENLWCINGEYGADPLALAYRVYAHS